jgi:ABC-type multidrug transport system permease subunit
MEADMTNPDVTHEEEVTVWAWIAGTVLVTVFLAAIIVAFSGKDIQVASNEPVLVPPITYPIGAP